MDKNLYVTVAKSVKAALPGIHLHAFSPEEIIYGAKRNKISVLDMILQLRDAGVNSFPGIVCCILLFQNCLLNKLQLLMFCTILVQIFFSILPFSALILLFYYHCFPTKSMTFVSEFLHRNERRNSQ